MPDPRQDLLPQPRPRSLARLEAEIAAAVAARARWLAQAETFEAAGRASRYTRGLLGMAEERLALLRQSREVLLRGEEGHEDDDEPA